MRTITMLTTTFAVLVACIIYTNAWTQKLPNVQGGSLKAPADIKIDGNPSEWNNTFKAYNKAVELFYTISNDGQNLYFTIQSPDHGIIQKIVAGGITFTLKSTDKKSTLPPVAITYPLFPANYETGGVSYTLRTNETLTDKELAVLNNKISGHVKEIRVTGVKDIADSTVSVYNELGIKAAGLINHKKTYTCELAFPIKYFQPLIDTTGTFKYTIQVNGLDYKITNVTIVSGTSMFAPQDAPVNHSSGNFLLSPTYFTAAYTLAK